MKKIAVISIVFGWLSFWFVDWSLPWLFKQIMGFVLIIGGFWCLIKTHKFMLKKTLLVILAIPSLILMVSSINPLPGLDFMKNDSIYKPAQDNVWHAKQKTKKTGNLTVTKNVKYGEKYPNSFLDIYSTPKSNPSLGTIVYVHGGGYMWGDKSAGDPNTGQDTDPILRKFLASGYKVVELNYALMPDYVFPSQVIQTNQAVDYLNKNADKYDLNMNKVIIGGGSAGANIAGGFANIVTNPRYAKLLKQRPAIGKTQLVAFVSNSGLLDNSRFGHASGSTLISYLFYQMGRVYTQENNLRGESTEISHSNVIKWATKDFPKTFVSDGNTGTFTDQAIDLHKKLNKFGVDNKLSVYPRSEAKLTHGFESQSSKQAKKTQQQMVNFLKNY